MKRRALIIIVFILQIGALQAQYEDIYHHFASNKNWFAAYAYNLHIDSTLVLDAILIQAHTDNDWDSLLNEFGTDNEHVCLNQNRTVIFFISPIDCLSCRQEMEEEKEYAYIYISCDIKSIAIFFPETDEEKYKINKMYLNKIKKEKSKK